MRIFRHSRIGANVPNPACGGTEAARRVKPGRKGSPEPKRARQDGALGNWMGRMTNRNRSVNRPALIGTETHARLRVSRGEGCFSFLASLGRARFSLMANDAQRRVSNQPRRSTPTGRRGRTGDRPASTPIAVPDSEPGNPWRRPPKRLGQPASDVASRGRRSRSSPRTGKPSTWRRAPVRIPFSGRIAKHDMGNHHAQHS